MFDIPNNGRQLKKGEPLGEQIRELEKKCKAEGVKYPRMTTDNLYSVPFVWMGRVPYRSDTLERVYLTQAARSRPCILPPEFIIDGEGRLPKEPSPLYALYLAYRDLGTERSLTKIAELAGRRRLANQESGKTRPGTGKGNASYFSAVCLRWRWAERCAAYDAQMEIEARKAIEQVAQQMHVEAIERKQTYLDNEHEIVVNGIERIKEMLAHPITSERYVTKEEKDEDGNLIAVYHTTIIEPAKWSYAAMAQFLAEVAKIGRLNLGMSTSNTAQKIESNVREVDRDKQMPVADQAAHEYASRKAEEAYFAALAEYESTQQPERLTASMALVAT